jgi:diguanylate cyclase (GGDEF)-like protein/PAS domain S-box-containing protein
MIHSGTSEPREVKLKEPSEVISDPVQITPNEMNELFQLVFKSNTDGILVSDTEGRIVLLNCNAEQFFNLSAEKILGRRLRLQNKINESNEVNILRPGKDPGIAEIRSIEVKVESRIYRISAFHDITELVRVREELRSLSLVDDLVNLCNGRGFFTLGQQQIKLSNRTGRGFYLFLANIDNYKKVTEKHGQQMGNRLIIQAAKILKDTFRTSDIVARISEETFAILAIEAEPESLDTMAKRLLSNLEIYNAAAGPDQSVLASMGTAHYNPAHPCSIDELMAFADMLLYGQKRGQQKSALLWYLEKENHSKINQEKVA